MIAPLCIYVVGGSGHFLCFDTGPDLGDCSLLRVDRRLLDAGGLTEALAGAALGFALLVGPYAIGGMGAGDVKALMALGAWLGAPATLGATAWALICGTSLDAVTARWRRRHQLERPESGAARGIPFAVALALGLAAQWWVGMPW